MNEQWRTIQEFPNYQISNLGRLYNNKRDCFMRTSINNYGHVKISLLSDSEKNRHTRSVAQLVAEAFVQPFDKSCDQVIILDGDFNNVAAYNLDWRPLWYAWKYTRQLKVRQPIYYRNLPVCNCVTGSEYGSVTEAGVREGLLFEDIWRSTYTAAELFPQGYIFEVIKRV